MKSIVDPKKAAPLLRTISVKFPHLWVISLCNISLARNDLLSFLLNYKAIGFLDLSCTDVTLDILQKALRHTTIFSLHLFNCPGLNQKDSASLKNSQLPQKISIGFLIYALPLTWSINGTFISFTDRKFWLNYFEKGPGMHSVIYRMHVNMRQTRKEVKPASMVLCNPWGDELMQRIPAKFTMVF
jgi:hypothetical protein